MALIIKSNIKKVVKELQRSKTSQSSASETKIERDKEGEVTSVAEEVGMALERKVEEVLRDAVERAKANKRRTLQARDI